MTSNTSGMCTAGMTSCATKDFSTVSSSERFIYLKLIFPTPLTLKTSKVTCYKLVQLIPKAKGMIAVIRHKGERSPKPVRKQVPPYFLEGNFHSNIHPEILPR